jgi:hypothetical protein
LSSPVYKGELGGILTRGSASSPTVSSSGKNFNDGIAFRSIGVIYYVRVLIRGENKCQSKKSIWVAVLKDGLEKVSDKKDNVLELI